MPPTIRESKLFWAREPETVAQRLAAANVAWPNQLPQGFEDRAWTWLHYGATKLHRGELYEAITMLTEFRKLALGPMLMHRAGLPQRGVRRIERFAGDVLAPTLADLNRSAIESALLASLSLYLDLRNDDPPQSEAPSMPAAPVEVVAARHQPREPRSERKIAPKTSNLGTLTHTLQKTVPI